MNELIAGTDCNTAIDWTQGAHRRMAGFLDRALAEASGAITLPVIFCGD
jgi:hypothetical protein